MVLSKSSAGKEGKVGSGSNRQYVRCNGREVGLMVRILSIAGRAGSALAVTGYRTGKVVSGVWQPAVASMPCRHVGWWGGRKEGEKINRPRPPYRPAAMSSPRVALRRTYQIPETKTHSEHKAHKAHKEHHATNAHNIAGYCVG